MIFDKEERDKHIVPEIEIKDNIEYLEEVEHFVRASVELNGLFKISYDCTANENTYFNTLNYALYAGMMILHPLCFSTQVFQMYDALADDVEVKDYVGWLLSQERNKYLKQNGEELQKRKIEGARAVVVLPGANKFFEFVDPGKLMRLASVFGKGLVLKPHPNDSVEVINWLKQQGLHKKVTVAGPLDDVYYLIDQVDTVFTTHISETCLIAMAKGKTVEPIDPFNNRLCGSFSHINNILWTSEDPINTINKVFSSPKSGVINPCVDDDWKDKVNKYMNYIAANRDRQFGFYDH